MDLISFGTIYSGFCCVTCVISCAFNGLLIWIVQQRRAGIGFYRFFTLATVLIGVSYSFALAGSQPLWYAGRGILGFFSIAPWNGNIKLIRFAYQFWFTSFVLVLLCMTCSFLYRYGLLCSPRIVYWFETSRRFMIILCLFLAICVWWLYDANYLLFQQSLKLRKMIHNKVSVEYEVDLMSSYVLIVNINFYCGFKIHTTVGVRTISHRMKQIHRNALKMMISQSLNPLLFLYAPVFINLIGMLVEIDFGQMPKVIAMSFSLFPIFNPVIVIYFTQEYKRFIFPRRSSTIQISTTKSYDHTF